ncbi:unnamed protein product [Trifolium pratense]|uniref:Uncharacterized protein n=1 Tax=Trifolium pratense TaxID=57577 RepID=A0ACB0KJP2_TRIPR|nr:unnamed protein product [Trifolium pratense]
MSQPIKSASHFSSSRAQNHFEQQMPSTYTYNSGILQKRSADCCTKKRDNDLHRLLFMPYGLPDGAELAYYVKGQFS